MFGLSTVVPEESIIICPNTSIQETSFDSGYNSPRHCAQTMDSAMLSDVRVITSPVKNLGMTMIKTSPSKGLSGGSGSIMDEMSHKPAIYGDVSLNEEWETDFFANFEENLFTLDLDDQTLDDILKSPKGKVAFNEIINSPKGKAMMNSPKGKKLKDKMKHFDTPDQYSPGQRILGSSDRNKMGATPIKPDTQNALKMSKRKLTMVTPNAGSKQSNKEKNIQVIAAKENEPPAPVVWPSQERLKFARNHFKATLEKAVKNVNRQVEMLRKPKSNQYPQLSKALSKPAKHNSQGKNVERRVSSRPPKPTSAGLLLSNCRIEDVWGEEEEDEDDLWTGDLPFTGLKQAVRKRKVKPSTVQTKKRKIRK